MPASKRRERQPSGVAGVSMRDLLAAGVAAKAVSTPPVAPPVKVEERRPAAERCPKAA
ncbi:hypothetical protein JIX56_17030 [Streptomyces sp. CA-210063]|uniref:hypothetical protein n=1 Tax=Streptomyces sp. CA-210063 TaxID=2801029 RepID=UPI00214BBD46|nr:hypothetical protein [Streptomyces sp. CA-210063]UUU31469.1 hypothetical protein JIX56_17030 [Streptomyces sp. CA-210063]